MPCRAEASTESTASSSVSRPKTPEAMARSLRFRATHDQEANPAKTRWRRTQSDTNQSPLQIP